MRNSKVQFVVHAAMIAAIYVVLTILSCAVQLMASRSGSDFRGADDSAVLYTGRNSGTVCRMPACQPSDGRSHLWM